MNYPINIEKSLKFKTEVLRAAQTVDALLAARAAGNGVIEVLAAMALDMEARETDQARVWRQMESRIQAFVFKTTCDEKTAFHEITAGLKARSLPSVLEKFDPAIDWGKNLQGYQGGELVIDNQDKQVRMARERMVLPVPWYALGTPVQDISKYEVTEYAASSVKVNWKVTKSANHSVFEDFGYLLFKEVRIGNEKQTVILFNSVHSIELGWMANLLPTAFRNVLAAKSLKDTFVGYIKNYLKVIG